MATWDKDKPAGNQKIRLSDEEIRANWDALQDALGREHTFPGTYGSTAGSHDDLITALIAELQKQTYTGADAGGTVDAITAVFSPALASLADNTLVCVIAAGANATTAPTFAPNGLAAKDIVKGVNQALSIADIPGAGYPCYLQYSSGYDAWILLNPAWKGSHACLTYKLGSGVSAADATSGAWRTVPINTEASDVDGIVDSSALPSFTLVAGTYKVEGLGTFRGGVYGALLRLYNVTDVAAVSEVIATSAYADAFAANSNFQSHFYGIFTLVDTKTLRLEYSVGHTLAGGLGAPSSLGDEVYAMIKINKLVT